MLNLIEINSTKEKMAATVEAMQARLNKLNAEIVRIKSDGSRSPAYIKETVEALQHAALPYFGDTMRALAAEAKIIKAQQLTWSSKPLLLSQQRFSDNERDDSTIRLRYMGELSLMDNALLSMTAEVATDEGNLPLLYQCLLASIATRATPDRRVDVDLTEVVIPDQTEALAAIDACLSYPARAELIAGQATNAGVSAMRKMELGRQMQNA